MVCLHRCGIRITRSVIHANVGYRRPKGWATKEVDYLKLSPEEKVEFYIDYTRTASEVCCVCIAYVQKWRVMWSSFCVLIGLESLCCARERVRQSINSPKTHH